MANGTKTKVSPYTGVSLNLAIWPWDDKYWKPTPEDRIKELSKAGALIAAQIDYLQNIKK